MFFVFAPFGAMLLASIVLSVVGTVLLNLFMPKP